MSNPTAGPIDQNTGNAPRAWARQDVALQIGIFDQDSICVDLSDLTELVVSILASQDAVSPLVTKIIAADDLIPTITLADWLSGEEQQANVPLTKSDLDQGLGGQPSKDFWIVVQGVTASGNVTFGAGPFTLYDAGAAIPPPAAGIVSRNAQTNSSGNSTITPMYPVHREKVTITGAAGVRSFILDVSQAPLAGARLDVLFDLPATANIVLAVYSGSLTGAMLATFTTDGQTLTARYEFEFNGSAWELAGAAIPAY